MQWTRSTTIVSAALTGLFVCSPRSSTAGEVRRVGDVLPDSTVRFKTGSSELTSRSAETLDRLAALLKRRVELTPVLLVGHADDRGTEEVNRRLSLGRAKNVKAALIARGLRAARLKVEGVGSLEPLSAEQTEAARAQNRRVEIWVTPRGPVARVGRVQRKVQAREPAAPEWRKAQKDQALRRLARVRTFDDSSSEIVFPRDDRVTMGPNALAVVYGSPSATTRSRRSTADVDLEEGSLFAALAEREGRMIDVEARSGRINIRSKNTRINADTLRRQATIEVYDGESTVESAGKTVTVARGFGTRVQDEKPPEPPRKLPDPPAWQTTEPVYRLEGEPVEMAWRLRPGTEGAEIQFGVGNDVGVERPVRLDRVYSSSTARSLRPGMYIARIASIDAIGLVGPPGAPRRFIVLPAPQSIDGTPLTRSGPSSPVQAPAPGPIRFVAPPETILSIQGDSSTTAVDVDLYGSQTVVVGVQATDGGPIRYVPLAIDVPRHRVEASVGEPETTDDGLTRIPVDIRVVDEDGQGVDGLAFDVGRMWAPSARLVTSSVGPSLLSPCHCRPPGGAGRAEPLGDGRYRYTLTATAGTPLPSTVRFYTPTGRRAVEAPLPASLAARVAEPPEGASTSGFFVNGHAGSLFGTEEDPVFQLGLGVGGRIAIHRRLAIDATAQGRWFRRRERGETFDVFPLTARAALAYTALTPQIYLGGGAGVRVGDVPVRPVGEVFLGILVPISAIELDLEAGYTAAGSDGDIDELAGWNVRLGLRWMP